ncbi:MAG TPA: hypothetical protein VI997_07160 [Candidatus Thermoplasmatota archaeon]|nr:hypothetical protein [Candidatus Thermoplasmatota archaeon]
MSRRTAVILMIACTSILAFAQPAAANTRGSVCVAPIGLPEDIGCATGDLQSVYKGCVPAGPEFQECTILWIMTLEISGTGVCGDAGTGDTGTTGNFCAIVGAFAQQRTDVHYVVPRRGYSGTNNAWVCAGVLNVEPECDFWEHAYYFPPMASSAPEIPSNCLPGESCFEVVPDWVEANTPDTGAVISFAVNTATSQVPRV